MIVGTVDGVTVGSCNSDINTIEGRQAWSRELNRDNRQNLEWRIDYCRAFQQSTKADVENLKQHYHQTGGKAAWRVMLQPSACSALTPALFVPQGFTSCRESLAVNGMIKLQKLAAMKNWLMTGKTSYHWM